MAQAQPDNCRQHFVQTRQLKPSCVAATATSAFTLPHSRAPKGRRLLCPQAPQPAPAARATGAGRSAGCSGFKWALQQRQLPVKQQGPCGPPARPRTCARARAQQPHCVREAPSKQRDLQRRHCHQREHSRRPVQPPRILRIAAQECGRELRRGGGDHQLIQQRPRQQVAALPQVCKLAAGLLVRYVSAMQTEARTATATALGRLAAGGQVAQGRTAGP